MPGDASRFVAKYDSASAMLRAIARYLRGDDFPVLGGTEAFTPLLIAANLLPKKVREFFYIRGGWLEGVPPGRIGELRADEVATYFVGCYPQRRYPAAVIGSANGAAVHLCCALGIPWLPQNFLIPIRHARFHPDDMQASLEFGREPARVLLEANPQLQVHQMHDPNQDRLMVQKISYFRAKYRSLPAAYERFLEKTLAPGATLFVLDCRLQWPTAQIGERHFYQPGGVGGLRPEEYVEGGPHVEAYLKREGSPRRCWDPPPIDAWHPEGEWGFEPALGEDLARVARRLGLRIRRIVFHEPEDFSPLVADLYRWWYARREIPANRLLGECFFLMEPWWALRIGAAPFWMVFPVEPSAASLEAYLNTAPPFDFIHLMLFSHGTPSWGVASIQRWQQILSYARSRGEFIGVDTRAYPRDLAALARYNQAIRKVPDRYPIPEPLPLDQLDTFLSERPRDYAVQWQEE